MLEHDHLDYWRSGRDYLVTRTSLLALASRYDVSAALYLNGFRKGRGGMRFTHELRYTFNYSTKAPDLLHMVDVVNDADPLNISVGNPDLDNEYRRTHNLIWSYTPDGKILSNRLNLSANFTTGALVRGYTYDTATGVRRNRTYNVDGNSGYTLGNTLMLQFGRSQQFTFSSATNAGITNYADMIGVNLSEPQKSKVTNRSLSENLKFGWQIGRQNIQLSGNATLRNTVSTREGFNDINARHFNYGVLGQFVIPGGFGINTDFMFYTRRGYGVSHLGTPHLYVFYAEIQSVAVI